MFSASLKGYDHRDPVQRGTGITSMERYLQQLCKHSFLSLWSYPNIYRDQGRSKASGDGKEVCDLLAVFQDHIILFSDKDCSFIGTGNLDLDWQRWFRKAIWKSARQIWGAERWIRDYPQLLFLDSSCKQPFPINLPDPSTAKFHRVLVAHGISEQCRKHFGGSGSLMIDPSVIGSMHYVSIEEGGKPFTVGQIDPRKGYIHIFDDNSLDIVMQTLDTITDFVTYLTKKEQLIQCGRLRFAAGEENLLAFYLQHYNSQMEHDFILPKNEAELIIEKGLWDEFANDPLRQAQIKADSKSYVWDKLIEKFNQHILDGTHYFFYSTNSRTIFDSEKIMPEPIMRFFAREDRLKRRVLARLLLETINTASSSDVRYRFVHPFTPDDPCYVFLVRSPEKKEQNREEWQMFLQLYSFGAKLVCPHARHIIAISIEKDVKRNTLLIENAAYLDTQGWSEKQQTHVQQLLRKRDLLKELKTFGEVNLEYPTATSIFPMRFPVGIGSPPPKMKGKDRNRPCWCGSGKKYKKCHG